ncbi:unnamed protein product [Peronospora farinosa]|uniref:Transcription factor CBF/NF-Y/archaeal histone domain-containing protein n=1 Tax=Peronospora farinosa TaxID=134698 RepID=A0AAV0UG35_9STRA|nr:unnamed protein product [Peronospora farinosa]CAI5735701.1 unnamed protein product [Peronospora farinosa]
MVHPATTGTTSSPRAQVHPSPSSTTSHIEAKTQTHPLIPSLSSIVSKKSQNVTDKTTLDFSSPCATCTTSTGVKTSGNTLISCVKPGADASAMDRTLRAQEEARRLQFALAQQQVQHYQVMTKQLETESNMTKKPSISMATSTSITSSSTTSVMEVTKTAEDLQKLRQELLTRLQQNVQRQAAITAQAVQKRSNDEWLRNKMLLEQEHMKLLRAHEQQLSQKPKGNHVTKATSIADSLLVQQQQVIRQQQMLRDMLQKQQKQQQTQLQLQMQRKKNGETNATVTQTTPTPKVSAKSYVTTTPTYYSVKKKQMKNTLDMDLEALARVCIRVANARTDSEMRQALEKMTSWLHRCTELPLLRLAQRDYRDSIAHRRPLLIQQGRWPLDLQVKSEYVTQKIAQMLGAFLLRQKNKAAQQQAAVQAAVQAAASAKCAVATALSSSNVSANGPISFSSTTATTGATSTAPVATLAITTTSAGCSATVGNRTSSSSTTVVTSIAPAATSTIVPKQPAAVASKSATPVATNSLPSTTTLVRPVKIPVKRDMLAIEREYAELKVQLQAKQVEINQKAKAKRDAAKLEAAKAMGVICNRETTVAMLPVTHKRPLQVDVPAFAKKQQRTDGYVLPSSPSTAVYRPSTPSVTPITPRAAQQFYDVDWTTRTSTESEDKMYLPLKVVSNIMSKVLPGAREEEAAAGGVSTKREEEQGKGRTLSLAISPSHSLQKHESSSQETVSISDEAVTFMQECVTEFLLYITSEARDLSVMQNRRTKKGVGLSISGTDVVKGMENLGFTPYAQVLAGYNEKVKASQDAAARKKMERKKLIQQQTMQKAAAAAAATIAANAAKAAAVGKSAGLPQSYAHANLKPATPLPLANTLTISRPNSSMSARIGITQGITPARTGIAAAKPSVAVTTTTKAPAVKTIPAAPSPHAASTTKSL